MLNTINLNANIPLIAALIVFLLTGCVSRPRPVEIESPPQRFAQVKFSISSLNEPGWLVALQHHSNLALIKKGAYTDENAVIRGMSRPLPKNMDDASFMEFAVASLRMESSDRYKPIEHTVSSLTFKGQACAQVHTKVEDLKAQKETKNPSSMVLDLYYRVCKHPDGHNAITVGYSDRFYPGHDDLQITQKAEAVFATLEFIGQ